MSNQIPNHPHGRPQAATLQHVPGALSYPIRFTDYDYPVYRLIWSERQGRASSPSEPRGCAGTCKRHWTDQRTTQCPIKFRIILTAQRDASPYHPEPRIPHPASRIPHPVSRIPPTHLHPTNPSLILCLRLRKAMETMVVPSRSRRAVEGSGITKSNSRMRRALKRT